MPPLDGDEDVFSPVDLHAQKYWEMMEWRAYGGSPQVQAKIDSIGTLRALQNAVDKAKATLLLGDGDPRCASAWRLAQDLRSAAIWLESAAAIARLRARALDDGKGEPHPF
ncbi:MAG: hypothetical protein H7Y60_12395 [Rhodospirillaceae bacterium]|nr:hypothetical protein [Rhodospirillales bacterium]